MSFDQGVKPIAGNYGDQFFQGNKDDVEFPSKSVKMRTEDIFDQLSQGIGVIAKKDNNFFKMGFFVSIRNNAYILTTNPDLPEVENDDELSNYSFYHKTGKYEIRNPENLAIDRVKEYGIRLFECFGKLAPNIHIQYLELAPDTLERKRGMKVYFTGSPLSTKNLIFHRGMISSLKRTHGVVRKITIDGHVLPGNSGSPLAIENNGKIYIIGVVFSQYVNRKLPKRTEFEADAKLLMLHDVLTQNISTGIGKAIDISHCKELLLEQDEDNESDERIDIISTIKVKEFESFVGWPIPKQDPILVYGPNGKQYHAEHDTHGGKHVFTPKGQQKKWNSHRLKNSIIESTKHHPNPALFYPELVNNGNYNALVEECVREWVNNGANPDEQWVEREEAVGASKGKPTNRIAIYHDFNIGSHIRPILPEEPH